MVSTPNSSLPPPSTYYQQKKSSKVTASPGYGEIYTGIPTFNNPTDRANYNANLVNQLGKATQPGTGGPITFGNPSPDDTAQAQQNSQINSYLQQLLANQQDPDVTVTTPGGNTLSGRGGGSKGAGSSTLAKELQQKLQIMNLDDQAKLLQLQQQQDQPAYNAILQKLNLQTSAANTAYNTQLRGLNTSSAAAGAYGAEGINQARSDLSSQLQNRLGTIDANRQTAALNEQYNQAALNTQIQQNFWERFAQAAQAGFFQNGGAANAPGAPKYGDKNLYGYTYTPYGWIQGK